MEGRDYRLGYARNGVPYFFTFLRNVNVRRGDVNVELCRQSFKDKYRVFSACIFTFMCHKSIIRNKEIVKKL